MFWKGFVCLKKFLKSTNDSQYKQCGVTPHFSTGQNNLLKKYWEKINSGTITDKITTNNAIYCNWITLKAQWQMWDIFQGVSSLWV